MNVKTVLAVIGACALIILFRVQIIQIINLIDQTAQTAPGTTR